MPVQGPYFIFYLLYLLSLVFLAIVQGVTEFLPISSSGHLAVLSSIFSRFGISPGTGPLTVTLTLHAGTLLSILVYYRKTLWDILVKLRLRLVALIILATIPAATFGLFIEKYFGEVLENLWIISPAFLLTAFLLYVSQKRYEREYGSPDSASNDSASSDSGLPLEKLTVFQALAVGCMQALAVLPGLSRSGSTIAAGLLTGMSQKDAATFSFILAIPVIGGACLLHAVKVAKAGFNSISVVEMSLGFVISFGVGLFALSWLIDWLQKGRLSWFSYWLVGMSAVAFILALLGSF